MKVGAKAGQRLLKGYLEAVEKLNGSACKNYSGKLS
jgi:hypothetical protein